MKKIVIYNGEVLTPSENIGDGAVVIEDGKITGVEKHKPQITDAHYIDACGCYISPGFIDLHTHGAGNADFMDNTVEACLQVAYTHAIHGTTLLFPTTLTSTNEELFEFFDIYEKAKAENVNGAAFGGIHLEGPYFSHAHRGAQDSRFLKNPDPKDYELILERSKGNIACWSIAPELPGALELGRGLVKRGIRPSIAHTEATYDDVVAAYEVGYKQMTHFYSAMNGITRHNAKRYAGCIEAGYLIDDMAIEIIADGVHVPKPLLQLVMKTKGVDNIMLVTDSMRGAGMPEGKSILGSLKNGQEIIIEDGVAKLLDRSAFAGSVATADRLVRTMVQIAEVPLIDAVCMISTTPARIAGLESTKGKIAIGYDADIVIFDKDINVQTTIVKGETINKQK